MICQDFPLHYIWPIIFEPFFFTQLRSSTVSQSTTEFLLRQFPLLRIKNPRETSRNSGTRRLFDPRWFHMDEYWWNFSMMNSRNNLRSKLKNEPTFTNLYLLVFPSPYPFSFFHLLRPWKLQAPKCAEVSTQLGLLTRILPHGFGGQVSRHDNSTFNFQNTYSWNGCVSWGLQDEVQEEGGLGNVGIQCG